MTPVNFFEKIYMFVHFEIWDVVVFAFLPNWYYTQQFKIIYNLAFKYKAENLAKLVLNALDLNAHRN